MLTVETPLFRFAFELLCLRLSPVSRTTAVFRTVTPPTPKHWLTRLTRFGRASGSSEAMQRHAGQRAPDLCVGEHSCQNGRLKHHGRKCELRRCTQLLHPSSFFVAVFDSTASCHIFMSTRCLIHVSDFQGSARSCKSVEIRRKQSR